MDFLADAAGLLSQMAREARERLLTAGAVALDVKLDMQALACNAAVGREVRQVLQRIERLSVLANEDAEALALELEEDALLRLRALQLNLDLHRGEHILEELARALLLFEQRHSILGLGGLSRCCLSRRIHLRFFDLFLQARLQLCHIGRRVSSLRLSHCGAIDIADADARILAADQAEEAAGRLLEHRVLQARWRTAEVSGGCLKRRLDRPAGPFHGICHIRQPPFSCRRGDTSTTAA